MHYENNRTTNPIQVLGIYMRHVCICMYIYIKSDGECVRLQVQQDRVTCGGVYICMYASMAVCIYVRMNKAASLAEVCT